MFKIILILALMPIQFCNADNYLKPEQNFYYSGLLKFDGLPANGKYDFYTEVYDDNENGDLLTELLLTKVQVIDGTFSLNLNLNPTDVNTKNLWIEISMKLNTDSKNFNQFWPRLAVPINQPKGKQFFQAITSTANKSSINQISLETLKFEKLKKAAVTVSNSKALFRQQAEFAAQHAPLEYDQSLKSILNQKDFNKISHVHNVLREIINAHLKGKLTGKLKDFKLRGNTSLTDSYTVIDEQILVDITTAKDPAATVKALKQMNGVKINAVASTPAYSVISVAVSAQSLFEMCLIPTLKSAIPVIVVSDKFYNKPLDNSLNKNSDTIKSQGAVSNQAEDALEVTALRRIFSGITGTGISVGVMSDSIDQVGNGVADSQASNDLPASALINILSDYTGPNPAPTDEGRAMMELIYDISPDLSTYAYATAFYGAASMANNITALSNAGMDIITDDIIYFNEPYFQDGVIDQAIQTFVNQGGFYFTAAGNYANTSYEETFDNFFSYHNYDSGDAFMQVTIAPFSRYRIILQWAEPWGNAITDLDLEIWDGVLGNIIAVGNTANIGGNPYEFLSLINNTNSSINANIAIRRVSGTNSPIFKFMTVGNITMNQFSNKGTGTAKPSSRYGIATGASPWYGRDTAEPFSSLGPVTRHFDAQGNPINKITLNKPDYMSIDGGNTTFFGRDIPEDSDSFRNFFGTSAAAPNAAAVAALMLQVAGGPGSLSQNQIKDLMNKSAVDLGDSGFDTLYGNGRINALGAVMLARGPQLPENYMYLNQYGDASQNRNLLSIQDVNSIMYATNQIGNTSIDIVESDVELDPMLALFLPDFDYVEGVDYDGGAGDDARINFTNGANFPYLFEVFSESMFSGVTAFNAKINAPDQQVTTRTANLSSNGTDLIYMKNISTRGHAEYYQYTAPFSGHVDIKLTTTGFDGNLRVYDNAGVLLNSTTTNPGVQKLLTIQDIVAGEDYIIQVVPNLYMGTGTFTLLVNFDQNLFTLSTFKTGNGSGLVQSDSTPGINCGSTCQYDYVEGQSVTLTAVPSQGDTFVGWSESPCVATGNQCVVTMNSANSITAEFMAPDEMFKDGFE